MGSRFFEIITADGSTKLATDDLPLRIGGAPDAHIKLNVLEVETCLIGESKGHLFLQPLTDSIDPIDIFHNNKKITDSVWIKSGDIMRVGSQQISYQISGDLVNISVANVAKPVLTPPPTAPAPPAASDKPLPRVAVNGKPNKKISTKAKIIAALFAVLLLTTILLLLTKSFEVEITPSPDKVSVAGFPPVFNIGEDGHFLAIKGKYTVQAQKEGYHPLSEAINVKSAANHFTFALTPLPGRIAFSTNPELNSTIMVDRTVVGTSPLHDIELSAGEHNVQVSRKRYKSINQQIKIEGYGKRQSFDFTLQPNWGEVTLTSSPAGAVIVVDGRQVVPTTPATIELLAGEHTIVMTMFKYQATEIILTVRAGMPLAPPSVLLKPALANLELTSSPPGAAVTIDRTFIGKTPLRHKVLSQKTHTVTLSAAGHKSSTQKIKLTAEQSKSINFNLAPEYGTVFISRQPSAAELLIDGLPQTKGKNRFQLLAMPHTIEVRATGYKAQIKKITPLLNSSQSIDFRLHPLQSTGINKAAALGRNLLLLAPARFSMGSSRREQGRRSNEIKREINLSRYFYIGAKEVTNGEFRQFKTNHSSESAAGHSLNSNKQPVVNVSWEEAVAYLNWLSAQDGLAPFYQKKDGKITVSNPLTNGYRLPLETEWAFAARFANRKQAAKYGWQGSFPPPDNSGNFADESARDLLPVVIKGYHDSFPISSPVASFTANAVGFFDMEGNVSEWCHDFYVPTPSPTTGPEQDPMGPKNGTHHVVRGASWRDSAVTELRLSYRGYSRKAQDDLGFRIARYAK